VATSKFRFDELLKCLKRKAERYFSFDVLISVGILDLFHLESAVSPMMLCNGSRLASTFQTLLLETG
jgi:hypothetical protein